MNEEKNKYKGQLKSITVKNENRDKRQIKQINKKEKKCRKSKP